MELALGSHHRYSAVSLARRFSRRSNTSGPPVCRHSVVVALLSVSLRWTPSLSVLSRSGGPHFCCNCCWTLSQCLARLDPQSVVVAVVVTLLSVSPCWMSSCCCTPLFCSVSRFAGCPVAVALASAGRSQSQGIAHLSSSGRHHSTRISTS